MKKAICLSVALCSLTLLSLGQGTYKTGVGLWIGDGYYYLLSASLKTFPR